MATPIPITVGTKTYALVATPTCPGPRSVSFTMRDTVAENENVFSLETQQSQVFPGGDRWEIQVTLPPMKRCDAAQWIAFLALLRGKLNVFQIGDPTATRPQGQPQSPTLPGPLIDNSTGGNAAGTTVLYTKAWTPSMFRLLMPMDYVQVGYRLYMCLDVVNTDASGNASFNIFPSLREQPGDGAGILLAKTSGLFRLTDNARKWNVDVVSEFGLSFSAKEAK